MGWTRQQFEDAYLVRDRDPQSPTLGQRITYGKAFARSLRPPFGTLAEHHRRLDLLINAGLDPSESTIVLGCGFGFLMEAAQERGHTWWGLDSSDWIHENLDRESNVGDRIIKAEATDPSVVATIRQATSLRFENVVTEALIECIPEEAVQRFFNLTNRIGNHHFHLYYEQTEDSNWEPLGLVGGREHNKQRFPHHTFVKVA